MRHRTRKRSSNRSRSVVSSSPPVPRVLDLLQHQALPTTKQVIEDNILDKFNVMFKNLEEKVAGIYTVIHSNSTLSGRIEELEHGVHELHTMWKELHTDMLSHQVPPQVITARVLVPSLTLIKSFDPNIEVYEELKQNERVYLIISDQTNHDSKTYTRIRRVYDNGTCKDYWVEYSLTNFGNFRLAT